MVDQAKQVYDALVVGSGASGGWACKRLAEAGLKVALVDADRPQSDQNFTEHVPGFKLRYRDQAPSVIRRTRPVQKDCYACMEYNYDWFANDLEEPYTTPKGMPFSKRPISPVRTVGPGRLHSFGARNRTGQHRPRSRALDCPLPLPSWGLA